MFCFLLRPKAPSTLLPPSYDPQMLGYSLVGNGGGGVGGVGDVFEDALVYESLEVCDEGVCSLCSLCSVVAVGWEVKIGMVLGSVTMGVIEDMDDDCDVVGYPTRIARMDLGANLSEVRLVLLWRIVDEVAEDVGGDERKYRPSQRLPCGALLCPEVLALLASSSPTTMFTNLLLSLKIFSMNCSYLIQSVSSKSESIMDDQFDEGKVDGLSNIFCVSSFFSSITYAVQQLFSSTTTSLVAYSDTDWAGCLTTRRSTSGYCVFLGKNLLFWSSKRQPMLNRSSVEAKYRGVVNAVAESCWLRNLLRELHTPLSSATLVYCDNVSVVYLSSNPVQHQRKKLIEIDIDFVRDLVAAGQVQVLHVPSHYQFADIFTKGLASALFEEFRSSLSVRCPPAQTTGEC
ncbi:ribonuclease H-like domain-containing protein [Tanacetum coccineum]|uniref:Ribonuclease H-like domain-containing protein n=1 Tax=Tanacetum coccineum TaxID=301880 RepID=A0ABQ5EQ37_9ASTR